ncbi:hypothetical protein BASA50_002558 [Batrachochytrium salamandrivorans]|uniref:protein S-acyltransferase n=1 Tax=Batrachochytrium salamandrivorans TaxID=1357716 RepID=A0ABQ8FKY8_9FUNG|nr:hypothetical protein BASA61_010527 [Batrachochytrium salamandrivorans]KAH6600100.1 hypothetical protein BASA50_002558 [Batrachochytrium salamandrivorans]KAH9276131.1 hypothetical protein BASA83_001404 [Batrachochytrium salamandrivorans]KAJ1330577.1 hypothetical protein BSLG_009339 [Batrachochytrium salamandrivorans]
MQVTGFDEPIFLDSQKKLSLLHRLPSELKELIFLGSCNRRLALTCHSFWSISQEPVVIAKSLLYRHGIWTPWLMTTDLHSPNQQTKYQNNTQNQDQISILASTNRSGDDLHQSHQLRAHKQRLATIVGAHYYPPGRILTTNSEQWISVVEDPQFTQDIALMIFDMHMDDDLYVEIATEHASMHGYLQLMKWLLPLAPTSSSRIGSGVTLLEADLAASNRIISTDSTFSSDITNYDIPSSHLPIASTGNYTKVPTLPTNTGLSQRLRDAALVQSCLFGHTQIASLLLLEGCARSSTDTGSALSMAAKYGHEECVRLLLAHSADVHADDDYALCWAARHGYTLIVQILLEAGADIHARRGCALNWAAEHGHDTTTRALIAAGADIHSNDDYALRWSCVRGQMDIATLLISHGANVHAVQDFSFRNAVKFGHLELVKILIAAGADVRACEDEAVKWALQHAHVKMLDVLCEAVQDLSVDYHDRIDECHAGNSFYIIDPDIDGDVEDVGATLTTTTAAATSDDTYTSDLPLNGDEVLRTISIQDPGIQNNPTELTVHQND